MVELVFDEEAGKVGVVAAEVVLQNHVARLGVCRIQAASNAYAGKSQPIGETRTRYSRKFRVNRAKGDVCCPHLTAKRDQSDRLLDVEQEHGYHK